MNSHQSVEISIKSDKHGLEFCRGTQDLFVFRLLHAEFSNMPAIVSNGTKK